jgi:uncharacterized protein YndB with AHSA1/START domain
MLESYMTESYVGAAVKGVVAHAEVLIAARPDRVWQVMTDPLSVSEYFFGAEVETD